MMPANFLKRIAALEKLVTEQALEIADIKARLPAEPKPKRPTITLKKPEYRQEVPNV